MDIKRMETLGKNRSVIRELFEYGNRRKAEIGAENVFDFSIGNPNVAPPAEVADELRRLLSEEDPVAVHGYTSAPGSAAARSAVAGDLNRRYGTAFGPENFYLTCGAAASLTISLSAVAENGSEVIIFAPYFPEYTVYIGTAGATPVVVPCREEDFQIDFDALEKAINEKTAAVLIDSPNNPSGAVITEENLKRLSAVLTGAERRFGRRIFLISDEPYREIVYDGVKVPFVTKYYRDTVICYSYSKSLSLPGERIGYVLVSPEIENWQDVYAAVCGAGRALGFVCAPAIFQHMLPACAGLTSDIGVYARNRELLYGALTEMGFSAVHPDGAFYLFVKSPEPDANAFSERAKKYELLLVPSDDFGVTGYVRVSYCVSTEQIERSLPAFRKLAEEYFK
ncbi:MAG: pyridoxal phosphate-dependent aminotransferase [Oscillospiraceae bacterium]